jgi:hypothetical protein
LGHEVRVGVRLVSAQPVMHVRDDKFKIEVGRNASQAVEEHDGIASSGDRHDESTIADSSSRKRLRQIGVDH